MAVLQIRPRDPTQARYSTVTINLCDASGRKVEGYTDTGEVVAIFSGKTDANGTLDVDLTPNADIEPENTGYLVRIGATEHLIIKGAATETVFDALAGELGPLAWTVPQTLYGGDASTSSWAIVINGGSA